MEMGDVQRTTTRRRIGAERLTPGDGTITLLKRNPRPVHTDLLEAGSCENCPRLICYNYKSACRNTAEQVRGLNVCSCLQVSRLS